MSRHGSAFAGVLIASMFIGCSYPRKIGDAPSRTPQPRHAGVIDHFVPHMSTEPANKGSRVSRFVRERRGTQLGPVVLFVHGRSAAAVPSFDLGYRDYSWMGYLADAGFDVFALDLQGLREFVQACGHGRSCSSSLRGDRARYPTNMTDRRDFFADWDRQTDSRNCPQQVDPAIREALWTSTIALDTLGSGWGATGVRRSPAFTAAGWTPDLPGRVQAPTLVIRGALDDQAPEQATRALYDALGGPKAYVTVSCGSHELVYEKQHAKLLQASAEWLRFGLVRSVNHEF